MRCKGPLAITLFMFALAGCQKSANARPSGASLETTPQQFAQAYVGAVQTKNVARVKALLHPQVLACINDANREYFDYLINQEIENSSNGDYKVTITKLTNNFPPLGVPADMFRYPVSPAYQLQIDWDPASSKSVSVIRTIAPENKKWFLVYACPNAAGIKFFHEQIAAGHKQREHANALAAELKPPLRTELKALLKQGHKIDAIKKYQSAAGVDLTTAVQVMNVLEKSSEAASPSAQH
jgi:ribosomal protein L7/L12